MLVSSSSYRQFSSDTGVYLFLDKKGSVIYAGKALNLKKRISSYFLGKNFGEKTKALVEQIVKIKTISVASEIEAFLLEERLIKKYRPRYNILLKDDKAYPFLKITIKDKYPALLVVRKEENDKSLYFGPFTNANSLRTVLKILRKIFPYKSVVNHGNSICLYNHLGLCPCPEVTHDLNYKNTIKHIVNFMKGKTNKVIKDLEKERNSYSKKEDFEKALILQKKIDAIRLITSPFYKPFEYEDNPNFREDIIKKELDSLIQILNENKVDVKKLTRIECYDISNTQGTNPTASMVVLTNGIKDNASYRRFKIRNDYLSKPNDFAMMEEVLSRRLKHSEWGFPDLIVVDGGKGQIGAAKNVLDKLSLWIPLIGLAKRDEIIITSKFLEIKLPQSSKALQIIMRIRNEAHRFAITYHKKLRSKAIYE